MSRAAGWPGLLDGLMAAPVNDTEAVKFDVHTVQHTAKTAGPRDGHCSRNTGPGLVPLQSIWKADHRTNRAAARLFLCATNAGSGICIDYNTNTAGRTVFATAGRTVNVTHEIS